MAFSSFRLEWGAGASPTSYTSAGITLAGGGGTQSVQQGILGRWDTTGLPEGQSHTLRLTVTGATGVTAQAQVAVVPDANLINGWPKRLNAALPLTSLPVSVPALADLDGDGTSEIILLETGGSVHVVRKNGAAYPGFPVSVGSWWYPNMPANVADLDGDGKPEIVLSVSDNSWTRKVVVLRSDGTSYPGWPEPRYSDASLGDGTPAAADLDGDGKKELIFADRTGQLHALRLDGRAAVGFPRQVFPSTASAIRPSLTVTEPRPGERPSIVVAVDGALYMLDSAGNVMPGWPVQTPTVGGSALAFVSGASVGDVDGNGFAEVYAVASTAYCAGCEAYVYGFDHSGAILPGWPRAVGVVRYNSAPVNRPALADVDGDAQLEVIAATDRVYVHGVGGLEASGGAGAVAPAVADVDGNGVPDVATAYDRNITVIAGSGATLWQRTFPTVAASGNAFSTPLVLGDLDGNGTVEMVALWSPFGSSNAYVYAIAWELPRSGSATGPQGWPIFGHGPGRSGVLIAQTGVAPAPTASSTPAAPSTPAPSSTPVATATLSATATPVPSNTPVPSPSPTRTSSPTSTAAPSDKLPPTVSIASPLNGSTVARNATVTIAGLASDDVGIARVEFYVNGALLCSAASPPQSCTWKVPSRNRATYTIEARAYDIAGNTATTSVRVTAQ